MKQLIIYQISWQLTSFLKTRQTILSLCYTLKRRINSISLFHLRLYLKSSVSLPQDLLMNDQVKEFAANVYETFSTPQELQK